MATISDEQGADWLGIGVSGRGARRGRMGRGRRQSVSPGGPVESGLGAPLSSTEGLQELEAEATVGRPEQESEGEAGPPRRGR